MFVNCDEHNMVRRVAGEKFGYLCNCCNEIVSTDHFVARDDGSRVICGRCITKLAELLHCQPESVIYAVVEDDDGYRQGVYPGGTE